MNDPKINVYEAEYQVSRGDIGKAFLLRWLIPWAFFLPLIFFGFSIPALIATLFVVSFIRQQIEHMYPEVFAVLYTIRSENLRNKKAAKNG